MNLKHADPFPTTTVHVLAMVDVPIFVRKFLQRNCSTKETACRCNS